MYSTVLVVTCILAGICKATEFGSYVIKGFFLKKVRRFFLLTFTILNPFLDTAGSLGCSVIYDSVRTV